jgi:nuclear transport factor 2 (NTF2) superfamily protein
MTKRPSLKALERHPAPAVVTEDAATARAAVASKQQPSRTGKKVVAVYLSESVWREVKVLAAKTDSTIDALMRRGLDLVLAENKLNRGAADL